MVGAEAVAASLCPLYDGAPAPGTLRGVVQVPPVFSERLELVSMSPPLIAALLNGDGTAARREVDVEVPAELTASGAPVLRLRLEQMRARPTLQTWLLRLMVSRAGPRRAVGHIGFHGQPDAGGRVEVGYTVLPAHRRQGLATEACLALFAWAGDAHGVTRFRASVSPGNEPSLAVVRKLGFRQTGTQWDEEDGEELVFERDL
jgi:RimJ/RimL family protein N-acetyltransferase